MDDIKTSGAVDEYAVISNHKFVCHFTEWAAGRPDDKITVVDDGTSTNETRLGAVRDILFAIDSLGLDDDMRDALLRAIRGQAAQMRCA